MNVKGTRLAFAVVLLSGLAPARDSLADASGCSRDFTLGSPSTARDGTPDCEGGGKGCYECAYSRRNTSDYDICAESVDPNVLPICALGVQQIPDWWPDPIPDTGGPDLPPPGDPNPSGNGDDGGLGPDYGMGGGGGYGGPYYYAYSPPAYLYPAPHYRPYNPSAP